MLEAGKHGRGLSQQVVWNEINVSICRAEGIHHIITSDTRMSGLHAVITESRLKIIVIVASSKLTRARLIFLHVLTHFPHIQPQGNSSERTTFHTSQNVHCTKSFL